MNKLYDLLSIDNADFNYFFTLSICEYLLDEIVNNKYTCVNYIINILFLRNKLKKIEIKSFYVNLFQNKGLHLNNFENLYLGNNLKWVLPLSNEKKLDNTQRMELQNNNVKAIITNVSWSKGKHTIFIKLSGYINTIYIGLVKYKESLNTNFNQSVNKWGFYSSSISNISDKRVLEFTFDCDKGKLQVKGLNSIIEFPKNERVYLGACFGNWGVEAEILKTLYFI